MTKRNNKRTPVDQFSARGEMLRTLSLGGAGGHYGFGRYPSGVFASVRFMTIVWAVR